MARGGKRPGAGRKPGSVNKRSREIAEAVIEGGETPLQFLVKVMRDESIPLPERVDAAKAAAPYIHPRLQAIEMSGSLSLTHEDALNELDE